MIESDFEQPDLSSGDPTCFGGLAYSVRNTNEFKEMNSDPTRNASQRVFEETEYPLQHDNM